MCVNQLCGVRAAEPAAEHDYVISFSNHSEHRDHKEHEGFYGFAFVRSSLWSQGVQIRKLTELDIDEFWELRLRALKDNPEAFGGTYEETVARGKEAMLWRLGQSGDSFTLGAFDEGMMGTVRFHREDGLKEKHKGYVFGMYVAPEARGQGVGKALMQELITQARTLEGVEQLHLAVVTSNDTAYNLYRSLGFEEYGIAPQALKQDGQYWKERLMVLRLRNEI